jgi:mRNA interferase RelE/StbE
MYEVGLTRCAYREYNKLQLQDQSRIDIILDRLSANPRPPGNRKIDGNIYRIRSGDWRVIYAVFDKNNLVLVGRIAKRSEDTYDRIEELF